MLQLTKIPPTVKRIILITCGIFILQIAVKKFTGIPWLEAWGCLILHSPEQGAAGVLPWLQVWRLLTYALLHYDFPHLFWNMLGLWLVGAALEEDLGSRRLAGVYIFSIVCGGISSVICELLGFGGSADTSILMGASAGTMGILFSYIALNPQSTMYFWMLIIIPIKARYLGAAILLWQLIGLFCYSASTTSYSAHLGGIAAGCLAALAVQRGWGGSITAHLQALRKRWQRRRIRVVK